MTEIENRYAQATIENFRLTPASLRPQLLKMLEQELNGLKPIRLFPQALSDESQVMGLGAHSLLL